VDIRDSKRPQFFDDKGRRFMAVEYQFWLGVQVPAPRGHVWGEIGNAVDDGHVGHSVIGTWDWRQYGLN